MEWQYRINVSTNSVFDLLAAFESMFRTSTDYILKIMPLVESQAKAPRQQTTGWCAFLQKVAL
jgi:hypothetical protein